MTCSLKFESDIDPVRMSCLSSSFRERSGSTRPVTPRCDSPSKCYCSMIIQEVPVSGASQDREPRLLPMGYISPKMYLPEASSQLLLATCRCLGPFPGKSAILPFCLCSSALSSVRLYLSPSLLATVNLLVYELLLCFDRGCSQMTLFVYSL